jgi:hypothetical protein
VPTLFFCGIITKVATEPLYLISSLSLLLGMTIVGSGVVLKEQSLVEQIKKKIFYH